MTSESQGMSVEGRWTPGPWLVNPASAWIEIPDRDAPVCALLWPTELRGEDETYANARLIAAAPDMFRALEALNGGARPANWNDDDLDPGERDAWRQLDAALAKALGETTHD